MVGSIVPELSRTVPVDAETRAFPEGIETMDINTRAVGLRCHVPVGQTQKPEPGMAGLPRFAGLNLLNGMFARFADPS